MHPLSATDGRTAARIRPSPESHDIRHIDGPLEGDDGDHSTGPTW